MYGSTMGLRPVVMRKLFVARRRETCFTGRTLDSSPRRAYTSLARKYLSWNNLVIELEKCLVLCANCHRKHHYQDEGL